MPQFRKALRETTRGAAGILFLSAILAVVTAWMHPRAPTYSEGRLEAGEITLSMAHRFEGNVLWIDARAAYEYEAGHIPGAVLLNEDDWDESLFRFFDAYADDPDALIVVYCGQEGCQSSKAVAARLRREAGLEQVYHLQGGWAAWTEAEGTP
ncbi:MAG: rhodanese [Opitutales bacterium]|nr:rhodanese [Opitutales bacterium]